jgi:hypothetical protein
VSSATLLKIAAVLALLQGIAHATLIIFASPKHGAEEVAVIDTMKSRRFNFLGAQRSYWDFYFGYALIAAIICVVEAALFWQVAGLGPGVIHTVASVFIAFNLIHAVLAWRYFFITPIIPDLLISGCLLAAILRAAA